MSVLTDDTSYLSAEKYVSCSEIYPIVCGLINGCLKRSDGDSSLSTKVEDTISTELKTQYKPAAVDTAKSVPVIAVL